MSLDEMLTLRDFINGNFHEIFQSPYSRSIYNKEVGWGVKPEGVLRISDHWNFESHGKIHCPTRSPVEQHAISVGQYKQGKFDILQSIHIVPYAELDFKKTVYRLFVDTRQNGWGAYIMKYDNFKLDKTFNDVEAIYGFDLYACN